MYEKNITLKPYSYKILPDHLQKIGKYYIETLDAYKTAEAFDVDLDKVDRIVGLMERYSGGPHHPRRKPFRDYLE